MEDLEETIRITRRAVNVTSDDYPNLAGWLNNLNNQFKSRFKRMGRIKNLEKAIRITRRAVIVKTLNKVEV